ncbi:hypothetical protein QUA35_24380, partial [Microcoleus sp. N9_B2]|uniref:hypothetical protein n=1 Tax=unclassified Microcoleus TaxID=2642155 RepID=UPI002FD547F7
INYDIEREEKAVVERRGFRPRFLVKSVLFWSQLSGREHQVYQKIDKISPIKVRVCAQVLSAIAQNPG